MVVNNPIAPSAIGSDSMAAPVWTIRLLGFATSDQKTDNEQ